MNREIKFRAWGRYGDWDEENNLRSWLMIDADSLCFEEFKPIAELLESKEGEEYFMQYTGLKDKNGKEIYEGDILKSWYSRDTSGKDIVWTIYQIEYEITEGAGASGFQIEFLNNAEIIGNIYENPNLIKCAI